MKELVIFAIGMVVGGGFTGLLWRMVFLPEAVREMCELGLIHYDDEVIRSYRVDSDA